MKKSELLKKLTALGLAVAMLTVTLAGCGSDPSPSQSPDSGSSSSTVEETGDTGDTGGTEEEVPVAKEPITFDIAVLKHAHSMTDDFNEQVAFQWAEEATGVHINWIMVEAGSTEKVNAMLTADLPDAFLGLLTTSQISSSPDSFVDLSGMLDEYAPHVVADYGKMGDGIEQVTMTDGSIRALMTGVQVAYSDDAPAGLYVNTVWLDKLGKDIPTTMDEFYEILCEFRDNDMDGDGDSTNEIPFKTSEGNWAAHVINMANYWGIAGWDSGNTSHYAMIKNGVVTPTVDTQAYREYLEYMHKLVADGLFDKEGFTETNDEFFAKLKSGVCGVVMCYSPWAMMAADLADQYQPIPVLKVDGYDFVKTGHKNNLIANKNGFAITTACEAPERLLEWWDYLSSDMRIKYTMRLGPEGGSWYISEEDGKAYNKTPDGLSDDFTLNNYAYTNGQVGNGTLILKDEDVVVTENDYELYFKIRTTGLVWDKMQDEYPPNRTVDASKLEERTFIETDLAAYIQNFSADSILNGVTDASWNSFLEGLNTYQYYDWIQWYQDYVDGVF